MLVTEIQAKEIFCPYAEAKCRGSNCMAWRWGEPRPWTRTQPYAMAISQWLRENPEPHKGFTPPDDEGIAAWEAWAEQAEAFAQSLEPKDPPTGDGWEWDSGFDDEEYVPFAQWVRTVTPRGYCGLAGPVIREEA